ncbi:MAG TPA: type I-E CRISPR-associated protein Cas7/Cse4/CasC, partial [Anaerolineae bacterium]
MNRDDANLPKDCDFGGARRARISSQCFKRAIRTDPIFATTTEVPNGTRTKYLAEKQLLPKLKSVLKPDSEAQALAWAFAEEYGMGIDDKGKTSVLLYLSDNETRAVAEAIAANRDALSTAIRQRAEAEKIEDKKKRDKALKEVRKPWADLIEGIRKATKERASAPDIALFGRMLADKPETNVDAACQVAHAISTHAVKMDIDYFTAVDDLLPNEETGAGMIGTTGFNSACFYRYLRLDYGKLLENLKDDGDLARKTVQGLMLAAEAAIPTG